jgi:hypothetical protein
MDIPIQLKDWLEGLAEVGPDELADVIMVESSALTNMLSRRRGDDRLGAPTIAALIGLHHTASILLDSLRTEGVPIDQHSVLVNRAMLAEHPREFVHRLRILSGARLEDMYQEKSTAPGTDDTVDREPRSAG